MNEKIKKIYYISSFKYKNLKKRDDTTQHVDQHI